MLLLIIDRAWKALKNLWKISQLRYPWAEKTLTLMRAGFLGPFSLLFNEQFLAILETFAQFVTSYAWASLLLLYKSDLLLI